MIFFPRLSFLTIALLLVVAPVAFSAEAVFDTKEEPTLLSETQIAAVETVNNLIQQCQEYQQDSDASCLLKKFADYTARKMDEQALETTLRERLATALEPYSCTDKSLSTSLPTRLATWKDPVQNQTLKVRVLHELPSSKITVVENFISPEECKALIGVAEEAGLAKATVMGGPKYFKHRKALQTNIVIPWDKEHDGHPIARASRRVFDYANHVLQGLHLEEAGQSNLKYLHYKGRGRDDPEPDKYEPHCDGICDGSQHRRGARIATMVLYCETADDGGHTNFKNVGVHVAAKPGDALFFSYVDAETMTMDNGYTVHSGCPVYEGDKKIVTQWLRYGVDADHPYTSFRGT